MNIMRKLLAGVLAWFLGSLPFAALAQDAGPLLRRADALAEEARLMSEKAKAAGSPSGLIEAGARLELASAKYAAARLLAAENLRSQAEEKLHRARDLARRIREAGGVSTDPPPRVDLPEPDALRQAEETAREVFKEDYAKDSRAEQRDFARRLLADSLEKCPPGSPDRWVIYREAQGAAARGADAKLAALAIDAGCREYAVDAIALKQAALAAVERQSSTPAEMTLLSEQYLALAAAALEDEDLETAARASELGLQDARKTGDSAVGGRAEEAARRFGAIRALHEGLPPARARLLQDPADADANLAVGLYACTAKGDWAVALPHLAKGSDPALKEAALKDLGAPGERIAAGDAWWKLSEREKDPARKVALLRRMAACYEKDPTEVQGLTKAKLVRRLDYAETAGDARVPVDLLRMIDPARDFTEGRWTCDGALLSCEQKLPKARVQIRYAPPTEYDVIVVIERKDGNDSFQVGLICGSQPCLMVVDGWGSTVAGLMLIDGRFADSNESTARQDPLLGLDRPTLVVVSVRNESVRLSVDGKRIVAWKGAFNRLWSHQDYKLPTAGALFLGCWDTRFAIEQATLQPVAGSGRRLP
jgi:hypothetical protein